VYVLALDKSGNWLMKKSKFLKLLLLFLSCFCMKICGTTEVGALNALIEHKAQLIVRKCVEKAREIREERICESKKEAIKLCLNDELKTKDVDKAQKNCERSFIL
jgi:hypothetical protein